MGQQLRARVKRVRRNRYNKRRVVAARAVAKAKA